MISVLLLICCAGCSNSSNSSETSSTTSALSESLDTEKFTADDFAKKFALDSVSAESENKNIFFEISGVYKGNLFEKTIQMNTSESYNDYSNYELRFEIDKDKFEAIEGLSEGDTITLKAKFKNITSYTLEFEETEFISLEKAVLTSEETTTTIETTFTEPSEHNINSYVDYLALKAKSDAETATDENVKEAVNWIIEHKDNLFFDNETMEKAIYYGRFVECKNKGTGNEYEKLGWQTFKTIKYVYIGEENIDDSTTQNNLEELLEIIKDLK